MTLEQMVAETEGDMPSTPGRPKTAGGRLHTEESRAKISAANKGRVPWNVGKQHSEETRRRIAEGTRKAMQRKAQERMRERERLRAEEPETYAALLAKEVASDAMKKAAAALKVKQKNEQRRRQAAERRQLKPEIFRGGAPTVAVRQRAVASCGRANFTFTAESRAKISESLRKRWQDPEYRARRANLTVRPETRLKLSTAMKAKWLDGQYRSRVTVNGSHSAERRAKIAASIRAKWEDPEYRKKATQGIRRARGNATALRRARGESSSVSPAARAKLSASMKRIWAARRQKELEDLRQYEAELAAKESREPRPVEKIPRMHTAVVSRRPGSVQTGETASKPRVALIEDAAPTERWEVMANEVTTAEFEAGGEAATCNDEENVADLIAWGNTIIDFGDDEDEEGEP